MAIVLLQSGVRKQSPKIMRLHLCIRAGCDGWMVAMENALEPTAWDTGYRVSSKGTLEMLGCCSEAPDQEDVLALLRAS